MKAPVESPKSKEQQSLTDLEEAQRWRSEGRRAAKRGEWSRAVVCFRRAASFAPFSHTIREEFADALEGQILSRSESPVDELGIEEAYDEPKTAPKSRRPPRLAAAAWSIDPASLVRRALPVTGAIAATLVFLFAAAAASEMIGGFLSPAKLPQVEQAEAPAALRDGLRAAADEMLDRKPEDAADRLEELAREFPEYADSEIRPVLARAIRLVGVQRLDNGQFEEAARYFGRTTELEPQAIDNWLELGAAWRNHALSREVSNDVAEKRRVLEKAEAAFERALSVDPKNSVALFRLGQVKADQNDRGEAVRAFRKVVENAPGSADADRARQQISLLTN